MSGCSKVPAGYRGIMVDLYGSTKGVSEREVGVGRYFVGWNQELYLFPTFLQNYTWTDDSEQISMQTMEGLTVRAAVGITYQIPPENVVKVFQQYRQGVQEITNVYMHNMVRDAMNHLSSSMDVIALYGERKNVFMDSVNEQVKREAAKNGIVVDKVYLIGSFALPSKVIDAIDRKIEAQQHADRVHNEIKTQQAEAEKKVIDAEANAKQITIAAQAQAKANLILAQSLTPEFVRYQYALKWDGKLPTMTGGVVPFVDVGGVKK